MSAPSLAAQKSALRARLRAARAQLDDRAERQRRLDAALLELPHLDASPDLVAVFSALPDEASPAALVARLRKEGTRLAYPRVEGDRLAFHVANPDELRPGPFGILEPGPEAETAPLADIDLWIVPGLGFTRQGARIGYGRGFYDRALSAARRERRGRPDAAAVGLAFEAQVVESLPLEPHDVVLEGLVTESGYAACSGAERTTP